LVDRFPRVALGDIAIPISQCIVATARAEGAIAKGDAVIGLTTNPTDALMDMSTTTTIDNPAGMGVAMEAGVDEGMFSVLLHGVIKVTCTGVVAVGRGMVTSATAGQLTVTALAAFSAQQPATVVAYAISDFGAADTGLALVVK